MGKTVSFELQDEVYDALQQISHRTGRAFNELAIEWLARKQLPAARPAEIVRSSREEQLRRAGNVRSGDPNAADSNRIESDLVREHENQHRGSDAR